MGGREFIGRVVSNRMQKTVVVAVSYVVWIPKYKVYQKRVSRHKARDEDQERVVGDVVRIRHAGRKLARWVSYRVVDTLRRASSYDPAAAARLVAERDAARAAAGAGAAAVTGGRPQPGQRQASFVDTARARLDAAGERLRLLREEYARRIGDVPMSGSVLAGANSGPGGTGSLAAAAAAVAGAGEKAAAAAGRSEPRAPSEAGAGPAAEGK